jgi:hypothetical protein
MDQNRFLERARLLAADALDLPTEDMYVVWFCKTLGNWKALVSTDAVSGRYVEVTHNGAKAETYVDVYAKTFNEAVSD